MSFINLCELDCNHELFIILYANQGHAPTLERVPPMIRVFVTFDCPQPSSGVNKRAFGISCGEDTDWPPSNNETLHYSLRKGIKQL